MALDKLTIINNGGLSTTSDYRVGVLTATKFVGPIEGSITATDASFSGNVSIAGTLTYEDVTNIDSIGLGTFRNGIQVLTGTATTALVVDGDARVTGILTVGSSSLTLDGTNNLVNVGTALTLGHTQGLQFHTQNLHAAGFEINNINASGIITASVFKGDDIDVTGNINATGLLGSGNITITSTSPAINFVDTNTNPDFRIVRSAAGLLIQDTTNGNADRFQIENDGTVVIAGDLDVDGHTNLDNVSVAGVTTMSGNLTISNTQPEIFLQDTNNNSDFKIQNVNGVFKILDATSNNGRFNITSDGTATFTQNLNANAGFDVTGNITATGNVSIGGTFYGDGSNLTGITQTTINNNANNRVITGSGTANTLNGESSLTYDGSKLFIGSTSFSNLNTAADDLVIGTESSGVNAGLSIITHSGNIGHLLFGDQDGGTRGGFRYQHSVDNLQGYSGGSAPFNLKSNALGLHEPYPTANSITIRGANTDDTPLLVLKRHTDGAQSDGEIIGKIQFMSNENNVDSGNHQPRAEIHGVTVNTSGAAKLDFYTVPNSTTTPIKRMTLNQEGQLTVPNNPFVMVHINTTSNRQTTGSKLIIPWDIIHARSTSSNVGSYFNTSNHRFTAPIDGRYLFVVSLNIRGDNIVYHRINGTNIHGAEYRLTEMVWDHIDSSIIYDMNANDYYDMTSQLFNGSGHRWNSGGTANYGWDCLSIYLLG